MIENASSDYRKRREEIALVAYGKEAKVRKPR
jgi:hypothetical protein